MPNSYRHTDGFTFYCSHVVSRYPCRRMWLIPKQRLRLNLTTWRQLRPEVLRVFMRVNTYMYVFTFAFMDTSIYMCTYTHTHTHKHVCVRALSMCVCVIVCEWSTQTLFFPLLLWGIRCIEVTDTPVLYLFLLFTPLLPPPSPPQDLFLPLRPRRLPSLTALTTSRCERASWRRNVCVVCII